MNIAKLVSRLLNFTNACWFDSDDAIEMYAMEISPDIICSGALGTANEQNRLQAPSDVGQVGLWWKPCVVQACGRWQRGIGGKLGDRTLSIELFFCLNIQKLQEQAFLLAHAHTEVFRPA